MKPLFTLCSLLLLLISPAKTQSTIAGTYDPATRLFHPADSTIWVDFFEQGLARFFQNGNAGLMDSTGKVLCPAQFHEMSRMKEGLFQVKKGYYHGLINRQGKVIVDCEFDEMGDVRNGYLMARKKGKYMLISAETGLLNANEYHALTHFSEGRAAFLRDQKIGLLTPEGKEIVIIPDFAREKYPLLYAYADKFACYTSKEMKASEPVLQFSEGLATLGEMQENGQMWMGCVNEKGKWVIQPQFERIQSFQNGYAPAMQNGKWGLIDRKGKAKVPFEYADLLRLDADHLLFSCTLKGQKRFGVMKNSGEACLPCTYDFIVGETQSVRLVDAVRDPFSESENPFLHYADTERRQKVAESFPLRSFLVKMNEKWGRLSLSGEEWIPAQYESLESVPGGNFIFGSEGKYGLMDGKGEIRIKATYPYLGYLFDGLYLSHNQRGWGVVDESGRKVLPFGYSGISRLNDSTGIAVTTNYTVPLHTGVPRYEFFGNYRIFDRSGIREGVPHPFSKTIEMIADFHNDAFITQYSPLLYMPRDLNPEISRGLSKPHLDRPYFRQVRGDFYIVGDVTAADPIPTALYEGRQDQYALSLVDGSGRTYISNVKGQLYTLGDDYSYLPRRSADFDFAPPRNLFVFGKSGRYGLRNILDAVVIPAEYEYLRYSEGLIEAGRIEGPRDEGKWYISLYDLSGRKLKETPSTSGRHPAREWREQHE